jgi:hypothetical protein
MKVKTFFVLVSIGMMSFSKQVSVSDEPYFYQVESTTLLGVDCPSADQLAKKLGCTTNYFHTTVKDHIKKDFSAELKKMGCDNPDICLDGDNVVLKCVNNGKTYATGVPLSAYK